MSKPNLTQGEGGARKKGPSGSKFDQHPSVRRGPSGSKFDQGPNGRTSSSGSKFDQQPSMATGTHAPQSGGHSRTGHMNKPGTGPTGSKFTQHKNNRGK